MFSDVPFIIFLTIATQIYIIKKFFEPSTTEIKPLKKTKEKEKKQKNEHEPTNEEIKLLVNQRHHKGAVAQFSKIKVVGVSFENENGTSRQSIISSLRVNDFINISKNPSEEYPDRISVYTKDGKCVGALSAEMAKMLNYFQFEKAIGRVDTLGKGGKGLFGLTVNFDVNLKKIIIDKEQRLNSNTEKYPPILLYYFYDFFKKKIGPDDILFAEHKNIGILKVDINSLFNHDSADSNRPKYIQMSSCNSSELKKFSFDSSFFKEYFLGILITWKDQAKINLDGIYFNINEKILSDFGMSSDGKKQIKENKYISIDEMMDLEAENYIPDDSYDTPYYWCYDEPDYNSNSSHYWSD